MENNASLHFGAIPGAKRDRIGAHAPKEHAHRSPYFLFRISYRIRLDYLNRQDRIWRAAIGLLVKPGEETPQAGYFSVPAPNCPVQIGLSRNSEGGCKVFAISTLRTLVRENYRESDLRESAWGRSILSLGRIDHERVKPLLDVLRTKDVLRGKP